MYSLIIGIILIAGILCVLIPEDIGRSVYRKIRNLYSVLDIKKIKISCIATMFFMCVAHMYAFVNGGFLFDTAIIYRGENKGLLATDKWLQQFVWILDGGVNQPWIAGLLAIAFMMIAVYCIVDLFGINTVCGIWIVAGLCSTNSSIICHQEYPGGNYIGALALAFACLAVWILEKGSVNIIEKSILVAILIAFSAGMYGSYVSMVPSLMLLIIIFNIFRGNSGRDNWRKAFRYLASFVLGMTIYYIILIWLMNVGSNTLTSYMGRDNLKQASGILNMIKSIPNAYAYIVGYYAGVLRYLPQFMELLLFVIMCIGIVITLYWGYIHRNQIKDLSLNIPLLVLAVALLPMAINLIYVMSSGYMHYLMVFTYVIPLLFFVKMGEDVFGESYVLAGKRWTRKINRIVLLQYVLLGVFLFYSVSMANAVYSNYHNMYEVSVSIGTRILDRIETCDGFNGTEEIILLGDMQENPYYGQPGEAPPIIDAFLGPGNPNNINGLNYGNRMGLFLENVLDSRLEYVYYPVLEECIRSEGIGSETYEHLQKMNIFPKSDSVCKIGDKIYIKFSDF